MTDPREKKMGESAMSFDRPQIDLSKLADCDIYHNGEFLCKLLPFVMALQRDFNNADPWRKIHEEHLKQCSITAAHLTALSKETP